MSNQPVWKMIANLGDANPLDHGGFFIYVDTTNVYPPEAVWLEITNESEEDEEELFTYREYRFPLEKCTYINGILSDNKFHPEIHAWWATPESQLSKRPQDTTYLSKMTDDPEKLIQMFCSDDPTQRALAYREIGEHHGFDNLDHDPLENLSRMQAEERYKECKCLK